MRILHTSDWHLGASLAGHERLAEQALFLDWLLQEACRQRLDALLISGDVYDTINPPIEAQRLLAQFMVGMRQRLPGCTVVATAGNHDSAARLESPRPFAEALGQLHLLGSAASHGDSCLLGLPGSDGKPAAWCLAVPFLRPSDLDCKVGEGEGPEEAFARTVGAYYAHLRELALARDPSLPIIAMGHCTLGGSQRAGSERLLIGGIESLPVEALESGMDYVALGHIHRAQTAGGKARYSGSPYAMDCDERRYAHSVCLVELGARGEAPNISLLDVPSEVALLRFPAKEGNWASTRAELMAYDWESVRNRPRELWPLVELAPEACGEILDLRGEVESLVGSLPLRLVRVRWQGGGFSAAAFSPLDLASPQAPAELFARHWAALHPGEAVPAELMRCFQEAADSIALEGV